MNDIIKLSEYHEWLRDLKQQIKTGQIKAALDEIIPQLVGQSKTIESQFVAIVFVCKSFVNFCFMLGNTANNIVCNTNIKYIIIMI